MDAAGAARGAGGRLRAMVRGAGALLAALSLLYLAAQLSQSWSHLAALRPRWGLVTVALLCGSGAMLLLALLWRGILLDLGEQLSVRAALRVWFLAQVVRYVPGNIWHLLGRAYLGREAGISAPPLALSLLLEWLQMGMGALVVAAASLPLWSERDALVGWVLLALPVLPFYGWPHAFQRPLDWAVRRLGGGHHAPPLPLRRRALLGGLVGYCGCWLLFGVGFYLLASAIYPLPLRALPTLVGSFAIAWVVGFLSFITPSGLGVREGVLAHLLGFVLPPPVALLLALLARLWFTIAELGCTALVALATRQGRV